MSKSQEQSVRQYIIGQEAHHTKEEFKSELIRFLEAHGVEYDARYVFD